MDGFSIKVKANPRIEMAGDWTDIPAYCQNYEGRVLNLAVEVSSHEIRRPYEIWVVAEKTSQPTLEVESLDRDARDCVKIGQKFALTSPKKDALYLAKATLNYVLDPRNAALDSAALGENTRRTGLRLVTYSSVPRGSGLGTSSILLTCARVAIESLLGVKHKLLRQCWDTYTMETELGLGSGWQDQIGGCFPGAKRIDYKPGLLPIVGQLESSTSFFRELEELLVLAHTGSGRDSVGILTFVGGEISRSHRERALVFELFKMADVVEQSIANGDIVEFGRCVNEISKVQFAMGQGRILGSYANLMDQLKDLCWGSRICGAGGEGFLMFLTRNLECRQRLCDQLDQKRIKWSSVRIGKGLEIEASSSGYFNRRPAALTPATKPPVLTNWKLRPSNGRSSVLVNTANEAPKQHQRKSLDHESLVLSAKKVLVPGSQAWLDLGLTEWPRFFVDAKGPRITDTHGNSYIDLFNGSGAVILGHGYSDQVKYVTDNIQHGASVSFRHLEEVRLALFLRTLVPFMDRFIFVKTGSECVHLALRIAAKLTGRSRVISLGYHGWLLPFDMSGSPIPDFGCIEQDWDLDSAIQRIRTEAKNLAAVIVSPSPFATDLEFYRRLEKETRDVGALFIMDEVKSGFRWAYPCLSASGEIRPDFLCFSKALANGFALAALAGKEEWLTKPEITSFFSTFACENIGLFAAAACLNALDGGAFGRFRNASTQLFNRLTDGFSGTEIQVVGVPTFFRLHFGEHIDGTQIATQLSARGILYHPKDEIIVTASHDELELLNYIAENIIDVCRCAVTSRA